MQQQLARGERLTELLKQPQYQPMAVEEQVLVIFAATKGHVDHLEVSVLARYQEELVAYFRANCEAVLGSIREGGKLEGDVVTGLTDGIQKFNEGFTA